jgi:hypothetical protein
MTVSSAPNDAPRPRASAGVQGCGLWVGSRTACGMGLPPPTHRGDRIRPVPSGRLVRARCTPRHSHADMVTSGDHVVGSTNGQITPSALIDLSRLACPSYVVQTKCNAGCVPASLCEDAAVGGLECGRGALCFPRGVPATASGCTPGRMRAQRRPGRIADILCSAGRVGAALGTWGQAACAGFGAAA